MIHVKFKPYDLMYVFCTSECSPWDCPLQPPMSSFLCTYCTTELSPRDSLLQCLYQHCRRLSLGQTSVVDTMKLAESTNTGNIYDFQSNVCGNGHMQRINRNDTIRNFAYLRIGILPVQDGSLWSSLTASYQSSHSVKWGSLRAM